MLDTSYVLDCGGILVRYIFLDRETHTFFGSYLEEDKGLEAALEIRAWPEYLERNRWLVGEDEDSKAFLETQCLMVLTGNRLLSHKRALFHGAALLWKERVWILTGPSGVGKTTQLRHWLRLQRRKVRVINGDKPLLAWREDGTIWVHGSPWKGKEGLGIRGLCAPLGGIILLEQGQENRIRRLSPKEAVLPLFVEFITWPENTEQIRDQAGILERVLEAVPVWKLTNLGDRDSAELTQKAIISYLEGEQ